MLAFCHSKVNPSIITESGSSSVGRAIAFQAIGREFEPRLPLKKSLLVNWFSGSFTDELVSK